MDHARTTTATCRRSAPTTPGAGSTSTTPTGGPAATPRSTTGCSQFGRALRRARERVLTDLGTDGDVARAGLRGRRTPAGPRLLPDRQRRVRRQARQLRPHHARARSTCAGRARCWCSLRRQVRDRAPGRDRRPARRSRRWRRCGGGAAATTACWPGRTAAPGGSLDSARVNDYVREATGCEATAKDFRTWHATVLAAAALAETDEPGESKASRKRAVSGAMREVAEFLGQHARPWPARRTSTRG